MKDPMFYKVVRPIIKFLFKTLYRPRFIGLNNIPSEGPIILVGNHTNYFDALFLISSTKRCVRFLAKHTLLKGPTKWIFKGMGIIPVNRTASNNKEALAKAEKVLNNNGVVAIFPEGTINRTDDIIMPFKYGAVKLGSITNATLIPFTITGKYRLFKKGLQIKFAECYKISNNDLDKENKILMDKVIKMLKEETIK